MYVSWFQAVTVTTPVSGLPAAWRSSGVSMPWSTALRRMCTSGSEISSITEVDFSQLDLDEPLPDDLTTNGERGTLEAFMQRGSGKTLRQLIGLGLVDTIELIGTPDTVADRMGEIMDEVGGDGFLLTCPSNRLNRRYVSEITDGLVPALWVSETDGNWSTLANWNSGQAPVAPVQGPGQVARVGALTLHEVRLPGSLDTVILERSGRTSR